MICNSCGITGYPVRAVLKVQSQRQVPSLTLPLLASYRSWEKQVGSWAWGTLGHSWQCVHGTKSLLCDLANSSDHSQSAHMTMPSIATWPGSTELSYDWGMNYGLRRCRVEYSMWYWAVYSKVLLVALRQNLCSIVRSLHSEMGGKKQMRPSQMLRNKGWGIL